MFMPVSSQVTTWNLNGSAEDSRNSPHLCNLVRDQNNALDQVVTEVKTYSCQDLLILESL